MGRQGRNCMHDHLEVGAVVIDVWDPFLRSCVFDLKLQLQRAGYYGISKSAVLLTKVFAGSKIASQHFGAVGSHEL